MKNKLTLAAILSWTLIGLGTSQGLAQDQQEQGQDTQQSPPVDPNQLREEQQNLVADQLLASLDELVPGDFEEGSELKTILKLAADAFARGDLEEALKQLERSNEYDTKTPPAQLMMAAMYFATGKVAEARTVLEAAAVNRQDYPGVYLAFARMAVNENRITDSLALYEKAERLMKEGKWNEDQMRRFRIDHKDGMVDVAIKQTRYEDAIAHLNDLAKLMPDNAKVPFRLAEIAFNQGKRSVAEGHLNKARELEPEREPVEMTLARWYSVKGRKEETAEWIEKAVEKNPEDGKVLTEYAKWHFQNREFAKGIDAIDRAIKNGGEPDLLTLLRGQVEFARGNYDAASEALSELHQKRPGKFEYTHMLALTLIESTDEAKRNKALDLAKINVQLNSQNQLALAAYGWVQFRLGNLQHAQQALRQAASTNQLNAETAYYMACFLANAGQDQQAMQLIDGALQSEGFILYRNQAEILKQKLIIKAQNADPGSEGDGSGDGEKSAEGGGGTEGGGDKSTKSDDGLK